MSRQPHKRDSLIWEPIAKPQPVQPPRTLDLVRREQRPSTESISENTNTLSMESLQHVPSIDTEVPDEMKWVAGIHQQTGVKLPGYWTHERSAYLQQIADAKKREREKTKNEKIERHGPEVEARQDRRKNNESDGNRAAEPNVNARDEGYGFWEAVARWKAWLLE